MSKQNTQRFLSNKNIGESLFATALTFLLTWLFFSVISFSVKPFNYVAKTIKSVQLTDLYYSGLETNSINSNVVLVNIENQDRKGIADILNKLNELDPAVVALDVLFASRVDTVGDPALAEAFDKLSDRLVLATTLDVKSGKVDGSYKAFDGLQFGHVNLPGNEDGTAVIREFPPVIKTESGDFPSFALKAAQVYDQKLADNLTSRANEFEHINYTGNRYAFQYFGYQEILEGVVEKKELEGKVVLLGFIGGLNRDAQDYEDKYFTPINEDFVGRARPDMFGAVIQANIIAMILDENYVDLVPFWIQLLVAIIFVAVHVYIYIYFFVRRHLWYHIAAKLIQLVSVCLVLFLVFYGIKDMNILFPTKYVLLPLILAVDVLYLYEALAVIAYKRFGWKSAFIHDH